MIFGFFIEICATLIEYLGALIFVDYKIYRPNLRRIVYFIFPITLFTVIVNSIEVVSINSIAAYFIYMGGFVFIVYRKEWLEKVLLVIVYFLLILICDYVGVAFFGVILQDNDYILYIMQIGSLTRVAFIFLAKSLLILTSIGVRVFIQKYVPLEKYKYLIALGILGSIFVYITYKFSSVYALIGWIIYLVFAGMLMGIFYFHSRWEKAENDRRILYLKTNSYIEYYENLLKVQEEKERLLHDLRYQYLNIFQMLEEERYPDCKVYLGKILDILEKNGYVQFTGNHYIDFIVNYKKLEAEKKEISVKIDADIVGNLIEFQQEDINVILGNLMDNAIEACEKIHDSERWITIQLDRVKGMLFITVVNSIKYIPNITDGVLITSKQEMKTAHGLGIKSVKHCIEKYDGIFNTEFDKNTFKVSITLFI